MKNETKRVLIHNNKLRIGAYEDRNNVQKTDYDENVFSYTCDYYVIKNEGLENEERLDYGKRDRATDYVNAYILQNGEPKYTHFETLETTGRNGKPALAVRYAYSKENKIDTLEFDFYTTEERDNFAEKVSLLHEKHIKEDAAFDYPTIKTILDETSKRPA